MSDGYPNLPGASLPYKMLAEFDLFSTPARKNLLNAIIRKVADELDTLLSAGSGGSPTSIMMCAVDSATVIQVDDMLWLDTDDVKPASAFVWNTDLGITQASFAAKFIGIALEASGAGETTPIQVETSPMILFEDYTVKSAAYEVGDALGPDKDTGDNLHRSRLVGSIASNSIARAMARSTSATTSLNVGFASAYHPGTSNVNGTLG